MGTLTDLSSVTVSLGAESTSNAEEDGQEAKGPQQQWPPTNAVNDEEGANVTSDGERLCSAGNLKRFSCRIPASWK